MSRRARFYQADVQRAVRAMEAVGKTVTGVDIRPDGSFTVLTGGEPEKPLDEFEVWEREHGGRAA